MTAARPVLLIAALFVGLASSPGAGQTADTTVKLYMPALASDGALGLRAATVLNLQIWNTLRSAPTPNPEHITFGSGLVIWAPSPLRVASHDSAEAAGRAEGADMVLWGKAWRYGDGVAVQAYLTLVDAVRDTASRWVTRVTREGGPVSLSVGVPRERYEFAPIVLESAMVESLESPAGLVIVAAKGSNQVLGPVGPDFRAWTHDRDWTEIQSGVIRGWIHVQQLSRRPSEVAEFVGGIIRLQRQDWVGAAQLFEHVIANPDAPPSVRVDANLMLALARSHYGGDRLGPIRKAYELNPHDVVTTKYECMEYVARLAVTSDATTVTQLRRQLNRILDERRYLYSPQDPWFVKVRQLVAPESE
jgi:hypothetical protein